MLYLTTLLICQYCTASMVDKKNSSLEHWWKNADRKIEVLGDKTNDATFLNKNPTWTDLRSNLTLHGERPALKVT